MNNYQTIVVHRKPFSDSDPDGNAVYIDVNKIVAYEDGQVFMDNVAFYVHETAQQISAQISDITESPDWMKKKLKDEMLLYMMKKMIGETDADEQRKTIG